MSTQGCPKATAAPPPPSPEKYAEVAKAMGMSDKCVIESRNLSKEASTSSSAVVITPVGGGAATVNTNENSHDLGMSAAGCSKVSLTVNTINESERQMTCNMNTTLSEQSGAASVTNSLEIKTVRFSEAKTANITAMHVKMFDKLSDLLLAMTNGLEPKMAPPGSSSEVVRIMAKLHQGRLDLLERNYNNLAKSYEKSLDMNRLSADIIDADINQVIDSTIDVKVQQEISESVKNTLIEEMKSVATAVVLDQTSTSLGPNALPQSEKDTLISKVNSEIDKQKTDISESISKNSMSVDNSNKIILQVEGSIRGGEVNQAIASQVSLVVMQQVKKSIEIGTQIAEEYIADTQTTTIDESIVEGQDAIINATEAGRAARADAMMQNNADQIKAVGEAVAAPISAVGDVVGKVAGAGMMLMLLPILVMGGLAVGGFIILPKLAPKIAAMSGMSPGMIKIALGITVVVVLALLGYFWLYPKFKQSKEPEARLSNNKINQRAPVQAIHSRTNKQSLTPYGKSLYYKGDRTARKIPSRIKINHGKNYTVPTKRKYVNKYSIIDEDENKDSGYAHTVHIQNKKEETPVMYVHTSRV